MYGSGTLSVKYNPPSSNIKSQLAFVAEFIHSVEIRKKRLVFCNCFLLENSV